MTREDKEEIRAVVAEAVTAALQTNSCTCNLSPAAQKELSHLMGMVKDIGHDSYAAGIEVMRDNNRYFFTIRKNVNHLSRGIAWLIIASGVGGALWVVAEGIKAAIRTVKGGP